MRHCVQCPGVGWQCLLPPAVPCLFDYSYVASPVMLGLSFLQRFVWRAQDESFVDGRYFRAPHAVGGASWTGDGDVMIVEHGSGPRAGAW